MSSFYITTPIYYVNARPHLGHAYTTIVADSLARFHKLLGQKTRFLTGTDEHGDKIVQAAEKAGLSPQDFVNNVSGEFKALWPQLGIDYDAFVRTTDPQHKACVQAFMQKVYDAGDIYFGEFGGYYCYGCERFYTEKELENGLCPQHLSKPEFISEKNYFFRMSKYLPWLLEHIKTHPDFIRPERYRHEVLAMLENGVLEDLCISRPKSRLTWGIELPFDTNYVCYVWFDALINYISSLNWPDGEAYADFWPGQHLVAKDILKPHAIFWPTMLKAAGLPVYQHLNVHGYWLVRDTKMSKSLGNVVDPVTLSTEFGLDAFRYFLLREMHFGSDASFTEDSMTTRVNADLANDLGNLYSRVLSMNAKYFGAMVPDPLGTTLHPDDESIRALATNAMQNYVQLFGEVRFAQGLDALWELVRALNKYVDTQAPWALYKQGNRERLANVLYTLLELLRKIALHVWPVMPQAATSMLEQLGCPVTKGSLPTTALRDEAHSWGSLQPGTVLAQASNLFPRRETAAVVEKAAKGDAKKAKQQAAAQAAAQEAVQAVAESPTLPPVAFEDFKKVDMRVGTIVVAERHPNADKLLRFEIDLGEGTPRQILSGLAAFYAPESLVGLQVCVVSNLAPRKIRGLESHGMVLTAEKDGKLELLTVKAPVPNGSAIG
ncbi:MAG: methionine--tRNA ligase [Desulfovibrionaceae bacterium]